MRLPVIVFACAVSLPGRAQAINSINFNYWYNLEGEVSMQLNPVKQGDSIVLFYTIRSNSPVVTSYHAQWEKRDSYTQRQGGVILTQDSLPMVRGKSEGKMRFSRPLKPWVLTCKIVNKQNGKAWIFFRQIEEHFPVNGYLEENGERLTRPYAMASGTYEVHGSGSGKPIHFSYYKDNFPTPSPPFADKEQKIDQFFFPDSTFTVTPGHAIGPFNKEGLYLAQEDTLSPEGFTFLVKKEPYPKYNKLTDLKGPLLFVTTGEENDRIGAAGEDKAKFDKVILEITKDKDRARNFMRNYFKRVEYANYSFTSFKEGWKTDRGMIIIIFGAPDEVQVLGQQEIWRYKSPHQEFTFSRVGSVYNPDHYVLVRDKQYTENWYMTVDLWRKSRF